MTWYAKQRYALKYAANTEQAVIEAKADARVNEAAVNKELNKTANRLAEHQVIEAKVSRAEVTSEVTAQKAVTQQQVIETNTKAIAQHPAGHQQRLDTALKGHRVKNQNAGYCQKL